MEGSLQSRQASTSVEKLASAKDWSIGGGEKNLNEIESTRIGDDHGYRKVAKNDHGYRKVAQDDHRAGWFETKFKCSRKQTQSNWLATARRCRSS
jgi:hypothetical protein